MRAPIPLSPTTVRDLTCPHKFRELRLLKHWPDQRARSPYLMRGASAHAVLAELYNPEFGSNPPHTDRLEEALRLAVAAEPYLDAYSRKMASDWIRGLVDVYLEWRDPFRKVLAVEQSAEFPLKLRGEQVAQVSARLDRLEVDEREPETLIVVDLSMGDKALSLSQVWMDLAAGKHLYKDHGFRRHRLEIHSITSEEVQTASYPGRSVKGVNLEVAEMAAAFRTAIASGSVQATISEACMYCALKRAGRCPIQVPVDVESLGFDDEEDD
jgi:hypothetical protein